MSDPLTHEIITGTSARRFTDYRVQIRTNLPVFRLGEFACRRR